MKRSKLTFDDGASGPLLFLQCLCSGVPTKIIYDEGGSTSSDYFKLSAGWRLLLGWSPNKNLGLLLFLSFDCIPLAPHSFTMSESIRTQEVDLIDWLIELSHNN